MYFHEGGNGEWTETNATKNITNGGIVKGWFKGVLNRMVRRVLAIRCRWERHRRMDKRRRAQKCAI